MKTAALTPSALPDVEPDTATPREAYLARVAAMTARSREQADGARSQAPGGLPSHNYLLCSANRRNYLPDYPSTDAAFYEHVLRHRDWASLDEGEDLAYFLTRFTGDTSFLADVHQRPRVFCTFHLGSYRVIHHFLLRHQVRFTLVVDRATLEQQGEKFEQLRAQNPAFQGGEFRLLDAESPSIGRQMMREVKAGRSLLFYLDGNTGVGGMHRQDDKLALIPFLHGRIYARKGIAFLAHLTGTPIVPLVSFRHSADELETHFFPAIEPDQALPREQFAVDTTRHLFGLLEPTVRRYPEQWEGWLYMHHFADVHGLREQHPPLPSPAPEELTGPLAFHTARYGLFAHAEGPQLFDRLTYQTFGISDKLATLLQQLDSLPLEVHQRLAMAPLFRDLWSRQVLIPAARRS
ncbi:hypothetical protein [Hymenobacter sp. CRA2]|uniref:hypothetical protein n=1 Tax=Hymenobacter sp. CRA2 TaxID=1955620 RepID=UPI00098FC25F|nr:hypothetical protein [Hymenobacter sp. CRA2]OON68373.1 hypothetical protein B0919_14615 [Hymenobacter sp. CRA2]